MVNPIQDPGHRHLSQKFQGARATGGEAHVGQGTGIQPRPQVRSEVRDDIRRIGPVGRHAAPADLAQEGKDELLSLRAIADNGRTLVGRIQIPSRGPGAEEVRSRGHCRL